MATTTAAPPKRPARRKGAGAAVLRDQGTADVAAVAARLAATTEILKTISASPDDPQPVFDLIVRHGRALCDAEQASVSEYDGELVHLRATQGYTVTFPSPFPCPPAHGNVHGRLVLEGAVIHIRDLEADPDGHYREVAQRLGTRSLLGVPLLRQGRVIGGIVLRRTQTGGFDDAQVALVQSFADQAVIAIASAETFRELQQRTRDLSESLEQQTATAEVLQVINASPGNLAPVFDAILEKAHSLCDVAYGSLELHDGERFYAVAVHGLSDAFAEQLRRGYSASESPATKPLLAGERFTLISDAANVEFPVFRTAAALEGIRTVLFVPLRRDDTLLGMIACARREVQPFTDKEVALLENFAAQAVIAMENARLLGELRESFEQQTAMADVLQVINASPGDASPVFDVILEKAHAVCGATIGSLGVFDGEFFRKLARYGYPPEMDAFLNRPYRPTPVLAPLFRGETVHITAVLARPEVTDVNEQWGAAIRASGMSVWLEVPLWKDGKLLGSISGWRTEPQPFSDKHVRLLENFAAQAVIAMENARLLTEQREALEQQTATADVLKVINASPGNLTPIFDAILEKAHSLCGSAMGALATFDGRHFRAVATRGYSATHEAAIRQPFLPNSFHRALLRGERFAHVADIRASEFANDEAITRSVVENTDLRTNLTVPLRKDGALLGFISAWRRDVRAFSEKEIALLENFAAQAVIAMENARLLGELQARTAELTRSVGELQALEEVLRAVNSSLDLETVLATIIDRAVPLAHADEGMIYEFDTAEEVFVPKAAYGMTGDRIARMRERRIRIGETYLGRSAAERRPVQISDVQQDPSTPEAKELLEGIHAVLAVPLLREDNVVGALVIRRRSEADFEPSTVKLLQTFAAQSVLAIANARLFQDAERARAAAEAALIDLRRAQDRLIQSEKMASLGQLTAGIAHEIKNPLNFVNNFSALSTELIDELNAALANAAIEGPTRAEVDELSAMIKGNLEKVVQHGKRADGIVRNMLLHARESGGERRRADLNATVEEALNLAYHGARAEKPGFDITLERNFDPAVGSLELYPQEFTRVMLNLFANGFYAATRKAQDGGHDFQPTLTVATEARAGEILIRVRDNGTGIPDSARARLFEPFFTTKPAGEGTGLGLSLSHDIVVKQHGGAIAVESRVGEYTEFTVTLPRPA